VRERQELADRDAHPQTPAAILVEGLRDDNAAATLIATFAACPLPVPAPRIPLRSSEQLLTDLDAADTSPRRPARPIASVSAHARRRRRERDAVPKSAFAALTA
jgi:hypothetical protein